jgi:hypothetical protein
MGKDYWATPCGHDYILSYVSWQNEQEYIWCMGWDQNGLQDIGAALFEEAGPFCMVMISVSLNVSCLTEHEYILIRNRDLNGFWFIMTLPVLERMEPLCTDMTYIQSDANWHKNNNMYGLEVGISTVFNISWPFLLGGGVMPWPILPSCVAWYKNNNIDGLEVGISAVFEMFGHFVLKWW